MKSQRLHACPPASPFPAYSYLIEPLLLLARPAQERVDEGTDCVRGPGAILARTTGIAAGHHVPQHCARALRGEM